MITTLCVKNLITRKYYNNIVLEHNIANSSSLNIRLNYKAVLHWILKVEANCIDSEADSCDNSYRSLSLY